MPVLVDEPTYLVRTPNGIQDLPNPLYRYVFNPVPGSKTSTDEAFEVHNVTGLQYTMRADNANEVLLMNGRCATLGLPQTPSALTASKASWNKYMAY